MFTNIVLVVVGFALLIYGADFLVSGAGSLARKMGVSSLVVGLTVVAFGTSAPELVVNILAASGGVTDLAIGNVLGSNLANILLVLGIVACIKPIALKSNTVWKEIPFSLLAAVLVVVMGSDLLITGSGPNVITRAEGLTLFVFFVVFLAYTFGIRKGGERPSEQVETYGYAKSTGYTLGGLTALLLGGKFVVDGAVTVAEAIGISNNLIAITVVALGTSLPELVTGIVAARKGHVDIAVGGVVGSNIFNILFILATTALVAPLAFGTSSFMDAIAVLVVTTFLFLFMFVGKRRELERWQGAFFIVMYVGYMGFAVLRG